MRRLLIQVGETKAYTPLNALDPCLAVPLGTYGHPKYIMTPLPHSPPPPTPE